MTFSSSLSICSSLSAFFFLFVPRPHRLLISRLLSLLRPRPLYLFLPSPLRLLLTRP